MDAVTVTLVFLTITVIILMIDIRGLKKKNAQLENNWNELRWIRDSYRRGIPALQKSIELIEEHLNIKEENVRPDTILVRRGKKK